MTGVQTCALPIFLDIAPYPDNAWGDNYVIVRANISNYQFGPVAGVAV